MDKMSDLNAQELGTNLVLVDINQYLNCEVVLCGLPLLKPVVWLGCYASKNRSTSETVSV
jgi:hypothetical protein